MNFVQKTSYSNRPVFFIRIFKSRSLSAKHISNGNITVQGIRIRKPNRNVVVDLITVKIREHIKAITILKNTYKKRTFCEAKECYENNINMSSNIKINNHYNSFVNRSGRPTKIDRRKIDKLMGRN